MKNSRKLFRLFKTINEVKKIIEILNKASRDKADQGLSLLTRAFFGLYWIFDNIVILKTMKFINGDFKANNKTAMTFWFLALITAFVQSLRNFIFSFKKEAQLKKDALQSSIDISVPLSQLKTAQRS